MINREGAGRFSAGIGQLLLLRVRAGNMEAPLGLGRLLLCITRKVGAVTVATGVYTH
jgi:hypothetical protein